MSQENVEIVQQVIDTWNRGDRRAWLELADEHVEFFPMRAALEGNAYRGHDGLRQFLVDVDEDWEYIHLDLGGMRDIGDQVVVLARWNARGRGSGVELHTDVGIVLTVRGSKFVEFRFFSDPGEALEAVGLSE